MPILRPRATLSALLAGLFAARPRRRPRTPRSATRTCGSAGALRCGTLAVPIDRSGRGPGQIGLARRASSPPASAPTDEAVVPLAGGPGQAALPFADDFAAVAEAAARAAATSLVFDQRGTGSSGAIGCFGDAGPELRDARSAPAPPRSAARAAFYRSIDSADDIEALRVAGGYRKLVLYGVSYGTRVALTYAARYPDRVAGLVLDSVVPLDGPGRVVAAVVRRAARACCASSAPAAPAGARRRARTPTCSALSQAPRRARRCSGPITGPDGTADHACA